MAAAGTANPHGLSAFMCGPARMLGAFQTGLRLTGVPGPRIHREYFDWR
jgi:ferredoxin-NADP reductase